MTIILIILSSFISMLLLVEAVLALRKQAFIKRRMKGEISESRGGIEIILKSWAAVIGKNIAKVELPFIQKMLKSTSVKLQMAGIDMPSSTFLGIQVLAAVGTALIIPIALGANDLFTVLLMAVPDGHFSRASRRSGYFNAAGGSRPGLRRGVKHTY